MKSVRARRRGLVLSLLMLQITNKDVMRMPASNNSSLPGQTIQQCVGSSNIFDRIQTPSNICWMVQHGGQTIQHLLSNICWMQCWMQCWIVWTGLKRLSLISGPFRPRVLRVLISVLLSTFCKRQKQFFQRPEWPY